MMNANENYDTTEYRKCICDSWNAIENNIMIKIFREILQIAVGNKTKLTYTPSFEEWESIYKMAEKQSLLGICFFVVQYLFSQIPSQVSNLRRNLFLRWAGMSAIIQQRNDLMNTRCADLQNLLNEAGFNICLMKGQAVAQLYGANLANLRQFGDIDVWVDGPYEKIIDYALSKDRSCYITIAHIKFNIFKDIDIELHPQPALLRCPWLNRKLQKFFADQRNDCFANYKYIGQNKICVTTLKHDIVFMMVHMYEHLLRHGIGLRQFMDYYFVLISVKDQKMRKSTMVIIESLGLGKFARGVMYILCTLFGMDEQFIICKQDPKIGQFILYELMQGGNFGHYDERDQMISSNHAIVRVFGGVKRSIRFFSLGLGEVICSPFWRLWHFCWMKKHHYK